ncbi:hypothetical protein PIB30_030833 [Stylosanthes scabra]|uniref:SWIM-type domain-containing protein n=1 Tax=Stylosanthes scabra TaxID=79078 RepID=A0ABU6TBE7_9FABA|nr:hypothetical protein [Stylosanthes scabra]
MGVGVPCKHAVAAIAMHRKGGYSPNDFVHMSLTMDAVRATYNYAVQPVPSLEFWNPNGCDGIEPPPIVRPAKRPRQRRIKDHVDMIVGNKDTTTSEHASNSVNAPQTPTDPLEKARKSKKKKPRIAPASNIGHAEEVDLSQSTPTPEEPHAPSSTPPANPPPVRFRMKQPIITPPPQQHSIQRSHKHSPSCPLLVSSLLRTFDKS